MPATYAHYRFGKEVFNQLPESAKDEIRKNRDLYLIGLHGPDILFYYKILKNNPVRETGISIHDRPAKDFFGPAIEKLQGIQDLESAKAYLYGFLCHFVLDSSCHPYIDYKIQASGISHTEIEAEFDRMLMIADGYNPLNHTITNHISTKKEGADIISPLLPNIRPEQVKSSLESMILCNFLIKATKESKRVAFHTALKMTGYYEDLRGLMVNKEANPFCKDSNLELMNLYNKGIHFAADMIEDYRYYQYFGKDQLDERFDRTFGAA